MNILRMSIHSPSEENFFRIILSSMLSESLRKPKARATNQDTWSAAVRLWFSVGSFSKRTSTNSRVKGEDVVPVLDRNQ